jgi:hypothetical protein
MLIALEAMDPTLKAVFFIIAVVLAAVAAWRSEHWPRLHPLAFAVFVVPFAWDALAAS